jgi:hypothetical protein
MFEIKSDVKSPFQIRLTFVHIHDDRIPISRDTQKAIDVRRESNQKARILREMSISVHSPTDWDRNKPPEKT